MNKFWDKKNKSAVQWVVPTIILLAFIIITLINYNTAMQNSVKTNTLDKIGKQAVKVCGYYQGALSSCENMAEEIAFFCQDAKDLFDSENVKLLSSCVEGAKLSNAYLVKADGSAVDYLGKTYSCLDDSEEFAEAIKGKNVPLVRENEKGESVMYIIASIRFNDEFKGAVVLAYHPSKLSELVPVPAYNYSVILNNGAVCEMIGEKNGIFTKGENVFDVFEDVDFIESSYKMLYQNFEGNRASTAFVMNSSGAKKYLIYQPISRTGAEVMIVVDESQIIRSIHEDNSVTRRFIIKVMVSIGIFVALLLCIYFLDRMANINESKELQAKAETDLLTDLYNKISSEKKIKEYLEGEGKNKISMMFILDIDNFKKINDTMGHAFGDEVLATFGKKIQSEFRVTDIVGRMGGDEFIIFLKDVKTDEIIRKEAERVSDFFKYFTVGQYTMYSPTASIGVALYPNDGNDFESLYKAADSAMYKAKKKGKNQLAFFKKEDLQIVRDDTGR